MSGVSVVHVAGEVDLATAVTFRDSLSPYLSDPTTALLVCDLSQVRFLACSGLSILLDAQAALNARGASLSVVANSPSVLRPVMVTGLRDALRVRSSLSAAVSQSTVD
ncbi:anti-sigma factor antagonist [Actinophytocola glycyrrhizae]|uniref:Anti-sigma factor antagonist n=1 Tax=Actinophytocola glycyrrhizae TaxID=2044873 RepID=A0ABV9S216_9PSEU